MKDRRKIQVHRRCYERGGTRYVEKVVVIVVEKERPGYRFGRYTLDADLGVLVCDSRQQSCSYYERRLLVAFFRAPDHFLTFREIERIFGWEPAERIPADANRITTGREILSLTNRDSHVFSIHLQNRG